MSDPDHPRDIRQAVQQLIDDGRQLVRLLPNSKQAGAKAWQNARPEALHFEPSDNVGVQLGSKSGHLIDLDFDIPEARQLSGLACFFSHLPAFRRVSLPVEAPGHRLVICRDAPNEVVPFGFRSRLERDAIEAAGISKAMILEIRAGRGYTAFPPSVIDGDQLVYNQGSTAIPEMSWADLRQRAGVLAFAAFAAACYPQEGSRDNYCFHLAGTLVQAGIEPEIAEEIIEAIAAMRSDDVAERQGKAIAAAARLAAGETVVGLPAFLDFIEMRACEKRLREWLQLSGEAETPSRRGSERIPEGAIDIGNPNLVERTRQIEDQLIRNGPPIFRRGDQLVYVMRLEADEIANGVRRAKNLLSLRAAQPEWLAYQASRTMRFGRRGGGRWTVVPPTPDLMRPLVVAIEDRRFPAIDGLVMTPTLTRNEPGYDSASKLYLGFEKGAFGDVPLQPSKVDALAALERLLQPARCFPFATPAARAVWLGAMLTAPVRGLLRTCPTFAFDAPAAGSGKTKLAQMVGILGLGVLPPAGSWGDNEAENSKVLFSVLRAGDPMLLFDNVDAPIGNADLCRVLTAPTITGRVLGVSEMVTLGTRTLIMFTGNNLQIAGDMTRRTVVCRIDAQAENPEDRQFDFDPVKHVEVHRGQLLADALIVTRAYHAAGRPGSLPPFNSFEDWDLVRGALVWLEQPDPIETMRGLRGQDPRREERSELIIVLLRKFGLNIEFRTRDIDSDGDPEVRRTIIRLTGRNEFSAKTAGKLLARHREQPFLGVTLRSRLDGAKQTVWWFNGEPAPELMAECRLRNDGSKSEPEM